MMRTCSLCGTNVKDEDAFCANCGQSMAEGSSQATAPIQDAPSPSASQPQQPIYQQPVYHQTVYQQPIYPPYAQEPVTVGEWMLNMLLCIIPVVNLIMLCIWAFGSNAKVSLRNWARATLIWASIGIALWIVLMVLVVSAMSVMQ